MRSRRWRQYMVSTWTTEVNREHIIALREDALTDHGLRITGSACRKAKLSQMLF